jgi:hypothetical protein
VTRITGADDRHDGILKFGSDVIIGRNELVHAT